MSEAEALRGLFKSPIEPRDSLEALATMGAVERRGKQMCGAYDDGHCWSCTLPPNHGYDDHVAGFGDKIVARWASTAAFTNDIGRIVDTDGPKPPDPRKLRDWQDIEKRAFELRDRAERLREYGRDRMAIGDPRGVRDAMSDLEATEAAAAALQWVLQERETIGR